MTFLRRFLGIFVMLAGIIGLVLSIAGLVGLWLVRPVLTTSITATIQTFSSSVDTSQKTLVITNEALGATVDSVDALSEMLGTTAVTVEDTQPIFSEVNGLMGETLPTTVEAATSSLNAAQEAAKSLEVAIKSFESFRLVIGAIPFLSSFVPPTQQAYNPEKPLADSLGELSTSLEDIPSTFTDISKSIDKADDNLGAIQANLETMSKNTALISDSLKQYQAMISESQSSMERLKTMLTDVQNNLGRILNIATLVLGLFFLWLLAAQAVIFSQGWELFHGTAGRMEGGAPKPTPAPASEDQTDAQSSQ